LKSFQRFILIQADDTGSSFWVNGTEFTKTGNQLLSIEPNATDEDREIISLTVVNPNELQGGVERYERDLLVEETELRVLRRTAPAGTFSMVGTVDGSPASESSTTAFGALEENSPESWFGIYHVTPYESETVLEVRVQESSFTDRTYTVGVGAGMIEAVAQIPDADEEATAGTVTLTSVGARLVGTYDLTLPGGAVTGSFDVEVLVERMP
jgi:hypothetical protein